VNAVDPCAGFIGGVILTFDTLQFCENESATVFGNSINTSGSYQGFFTSSEGCDSIHRIEVELLSVLNTSEMITACEGDSVELFGNIFTESEIIISESLSSFGCDSVHTTSLVFMNSILTTELVEACEGETVEVFGSLLSEDDVVSQSFLSVSGCDSTHEVTVLFSQEVEVYLADTICANESILFFNQEVTASGTYYHSLAPLDESCDSIVILNAVVRQEVLPLLSLDTTILSGQDFQFDIIDLDSNYQYEWSASAGLSCTNCPNPIINIQDDQSILLSIISPEGCTEQQNIQLRVDKSKNLYIPNVFSPNGDGENDKWNLFSDDTVEQINFVQIFDRWGNLVFRKNNFQTNNVTIGWDGTFKGKILNPGVFVYQISVEYRDGTSEIKAGDLLLIH